MPGKKNRSRNQAEAPQDSAEQPAAPGAEDLDSLLRRHKRNLRKASAEGFLAGVIAMLRPGDLVLDCGANVGDVSDRLAASGADIVAFEPDPYSFSRLTERMEGRSNVTLVNAAVGVTAGTVQLMRAANFDKNPKGASVKSTIVAGGGRMGQGGETIDVPMIDFPAWLRGKIAERGEIAFIKMDIEGAELDLLEELDRQGILDSVRCLVAETHERKFKDLRGRFRALRELVAEKYPGGRVNLDWI